MGTRTLGCPTRYGLSIMRQPGEMTTLGFHPPGLGSLTDIQSIQWRRVRSDSATASVFVKGCGLNDRVLVREGGIIDPWAFELTVHRDSRIAFMGPILDVIWHADSGTWELQAGDMMTWPQVREIQPDFLGYVSPNPPADAATIMYDLLQTYFQTNNDDPDLFRHVMQLGTASVLFNTFYKTATFSVADKMRDLVNAGATFTTVGRTTLIFGEDPPNLDIPMILSANDISGQVKLFKSGRSPFGVHAVGRGQDITFGIGPTVADEEYFGKVSRITQFNEITDQTQLDNLTTAWYNQIREMRHDIDISAGAKIGPETLFYGGTELFGVFSRWALDFLIPGYRYDVAINKPTFPIKSAFPMVLDELTVDWTPAGGEEVKVSFAPLGREQP